MTTAITMFAESGARSRSHGLRPEVIAAQLARLGLESLAGECSWENYTQEYEHQVSRAAAIGITHLIFGDIMCDAHRAWNERVCAKHGIEPVLPLWGQSTSEVAAEFIAGGSTALIVTARVSYLDDSWLGRTLTRDAVRELETLGVDPCGEHGEFHTLVTNTPLFSTPLSVSPGMRVMRSDCWALDVVLSDAMGAAR